MIRRGLQRGTLKRGTRTLSGYFVDSVDGDDQGGANPCTSQATPAKTIAQLLSVSPPANSQIWIKRGSSFKEMIYPAGIGITGGLLNGSTVRAYGTGARPIFDASDVISAGSWTKTVGLTNVYQANVTLSASYSAVRAGMGNRIWEDGTRLTYVADTATCDATPGSWTGPTRPTAGPDTFYVHASDGSNPGASGKVYSWPARPYCVHGGQYYTDTNRLAIIEGVDCRYWGHHDGGLLTASYLSDFSTNSGGFGPVDPLHSLWCNGYAESGSFGDVVSYGNDQPPVTIRNCTVTTDANVASNVTAVFFHTGSIGGFKHAKMTYENLTFTGACNAAFAGDAADQVLIINPVLTSNNVRQLASYTNVDRVDIVSPIWVRNTASDDGNCVALSNVPAFNLVGARLVTNRAAPFALISADTTGNSSINVTGCSIVFTAGPPSMSTAYRWVVSNRTASAAIVFTHNLLYYVGSPLYLPSSTNVTSESNLVESGANAPSGWNVNGTTYATWALWKASGRDTGSVQETITFAGDVTAGDTLTSGGSANLIGAGADAYGDAYAEAYLETVP